MVLRDAPDFRPSAALAVSGDGEIDGYSSILRLVNPAIISGDTTIVYIFSDETADVDPGPGFLRLNNVLQDVATGMRVSISDQQLRDWEPMLDSFDNTAGALKGFIRLSAREDVTRWILFTLSALVNETGYFNFTVEVSATSGDETPFLDGELLLLNFDRTNDGLLQEETGPIFMGVEAGTQLPEALNMATATSMLNIFTAVLQGLVPASGGGTVNFLRADGTFAPPAGGETITASGGLEKIGSNIQMLPMAPGTMKGLQIDAAGAAIPVDLTGLEQGENLRRNNVFDLALTGGTGAGAGGVFIGNDILIPDGVSQVRVSATSAIPVRIAAFRSDNPLGHEITFFLDFNPLAPVQFIVNSVEGVAAEGILFPALVFNEIAVLTRTLECVTFRTADAMSVGTRRWAMFGAVPHHILNLDQYTAGVLAIHDGNEFVVRSLTGDDLDLSSVTYTGGNFIDVVGTVISLTDVDAHDVLCRQAGTTGPVNTANVGENQFLGRPGIGGVLQGTQALTDMIANQAVTFPKIADQNANSIMGRFNNTTGQASSLSIATHAFPARQAGDLFNKSFSSLAGNGLSYNTGTGAVDAVAGEAIPAGNNRAITRNSGGTLIATSMGDHSVLIRVTGSPVAFAFPPNGVLRRDGSGNLDTSTLVTGNYGNATVTAAKVVTADTFIWTGNHQFGSGVNLNGVQTLGFSGATQNNVSVNNSTNILRINVTSNTVCTGLDLNNVGSGRLVLIFNITTAGTSDNITFNGDDAASLAANRFSLGTTSMSMRQGRGVWAWHDAITNRVRLAIGPTNTGSPPQGS